MKALVYNTDFKNNYNLINREKPQIIEGGRGSGKTMLFNLILRLFEPTTGKITLDNIDIFDFSDKTYSKNVSVVNQKPFIFNILSL